MQNTITPTLDVETLTGEALSLAFLGKALYTEPEREWLQGLIEHPERYLPSKAAACTRARRSQQARCHNRGQDKNACFHGVLTSL